MKKISEISEKCVLAAPHSGAPEDFASAAIQFSGVPECGADIQNKEVSGVPEGGTDTQTDDATRYGAPQNEVYFQRAAAGEEGIRDVKLPRKYRLKRHENTGQNTTKTPIIFVNSSTSFNFAQKNRDEIFEENRRQCSAR